MWNFIKCFLEIQIDNIYRWPLIHPFSYFLKKKKKLLGMILLLGNHAEKSLLIYVWRESQSYDP